MTNTNTTVATGCAAIILMLAFTFGVAAFVGWILMLVLAGFGLTVGFWPCTGAIFVILWVARMIRGTKE